MRLNKTHLGMSLSGIVFFLLIFVTSCSTLKELGSVEKPRVSIEQTRITDLSLKEATLTFDVRIENPNAVALSMDAYRYDFDVNGLDFIQGEQDRELTIEAETGSTIEIPVQLNYNELYELIGSLKNKDEIPFSFQSDFTFDLPLIGKKSFPLKKEGSFPAVRAPSLSAGNIEVNSLSFSSADLIMNLNVENPNSFGVSLRDLNYRLNLNGLETVSGETAAESLIPAGSEGTLQIPFKISFAEAGMAAYRIIRGGEDLSYQLNGSASLGADLPVFSNSIFNFDKSGTVNILN